MESNSISEKTPMFVCDYCKTFFYSKEECLEHEKKCFEKDLVKVKIVYVDVDLCSGRNDGFGERDVVLSPKKDVGGLIRYVNVYNDKFMTEILGVEFLLLANFDQVSFHHVESLGRERYIVYYSIKNTDTKIAKEKILEELCSKRKERDLSFQEAANSLKDVK